MVLRSHGIEVAAAASVGLLLIQLVRSLRRDASAAAARAKLLQAQLLRTEDALAIMNRAQHDLNLCQLPPLPEWLSQPPTGWSRCVAALKAIGEGYARFANKASRRKCTLISCFPDDAPQPEKSRVDEVLARHALRVFPELCKMLRNKPGLVLLFLDAPTCATTAALLRAIPELSGCTSRICIPQADPGHYVRQIRGVGCADDLGGDAVTMHLNVCNQRLDQWLSSHRQCPHLQVPVAFFDFESSVYGR